MVIAIGAVALVSWLRHDPVAEQEAAELERLSKLPAPNSPEAAVKVAEEFCTLMAERKFVDARLIAEGNAAKMVEFELRQRFGPDTKKDPELVNLIDRGLKARLVAFKKRGLDVRDDGHTVIVDADVTLMMNNRPLPMKPRLTLTWRFDHWAVSEYGRAAGPLTGPASRSAPASRPTAGKAASGS